MPDRWPTWWEWLGLGAGGMLLYYVLRPSDASASVPTTDSGQTYSPGVPVQHTSDPPITVAPGVPPMPPPNAGFSAPRPVASATLINRLRTSEQARQIFAYQALLWSWGHYNWNFGYSNTVPDGVISPGGPTEKKIQEINVLAHDPASVAFRGASTMLQALAVLPTFQPNANYLLPFKLPRDVIDQVNATIGRMVGSAVTLQVVPS